MKLRGLAVLAVLLACASAEAAVGFGGNGLGSWGRAPGINKQMSRFR